PDIGARPMSFASGARIRAHHVAFWLASVTVIFIAYRDVIFRHRTFVPVGVVQGTYATPPFAAGYLGRAAPEVPEVDAGAEAWQVHPWAYHERRALTKWTLPFWNGHSGLGLPLLSNGQVAIFSPLHWIELLDPDLVSLWDAHGLLIRFAAALFSCYLLFRLGASVPTACLGAPLAGVHGSFTALVIRADLNAYALMPFLLYCVLRLRQERDYQSGAALGIAVLLVLTAGHPQPVTAVLLSGAL